MLSIWEILFDLYWSSGHTLALPPLEKLAPVAVGRAAGIGNYLPTNGKAGGKLPAGNDTLRSPALSFSAASRKAATNQR